MEHLTDDVYLEEPAVLAAAGQGAAQAGRGRPSGSNVPINPPAGDREITYSEALREAMAQALASDPKVFLLGEDIGVYGGAFGVTKDLVEEFGPDRVRDTPISENAIIGAAVGSAVLGMRPIAEMQFQDFITLGMEQTVLQGAKIRYMFGGKATVPMVVRCRPGRARVRRHSTPRAWSRGSSACRVSRWWRRRRRTTRRGCCWPPSRTTTR